MKQNSIKQGLMALAASASLGLSTQTVSAQPQYDAYPDYSVQFIDAPEPVVPSTLAGWMNNSGVIYAQYTDMNGLQQSAVWENGAWTMLRFEGVQQVGSGVVTSSGMTGLTLIWNDPKKPMTGAIYQRGEIELLGELPDYPGLSYYVQGLNNQRMLPVLVIDTHGNLHGVLLDRNLQIICTLDHAGSWLNVPTGINNRGLGVGFYNTATGQNAFWYDSRTGVMNDITVPNARITQAYGINNQGDIVGLWVKKGSPTSGYILKNGKFGDFFVPGGLWCNVNSVNDNGQLCAIFVDTDLVDHLVIATPRSGKK
jgi:hypothetical protein